jgi:hypothetical protein
MSKKKLKGSGILVVILAALVFTIYASTSYSEAEHFSILQKKYESDIMNYYEKDLNNIENVYESLVNIY